MQCTMWTRTLQEWEKLRLAVCLSVNVSECGVNFNVNAKPVWVCLWCQIRIRVSIRVRTHACMLMRVWCDRDRLGIECRVCNNASITRLYQWYVMVSYWIGCTYLLIFDHLTCSCVVRTYLRSNATSGTNRHANAVFGSQQCRRSQRCQQHACHRIVCHRYLSMYASLLCCVPCSQLFFSQTKRRRHDCIKNILDCFLPFFWESERGELGSLAAVKLVRMDEIMKSNLRLQGHGTGNYLPPTSLSL